VRESDVHKALVKRIETLGGEVRRVSWQGRRAAPDVFVLLTKRSTWIEEKRPGEEPTDAQLREHARMRRAGCTVLVISTLAEIDYHFPLPERLQ
jgi:hypothetical protein